MPGSSPSHPVGPHADEDEHLRELVGHIHVATLQLARVQADLVRRRSAVMAIAIERMARSGSRVSRERELPLRSVALEIAAMTHAHDLTVQKELGEAHTLTEKFAATVDALESGRISMRHVNAVLDTGTVIDDDDTRRGWEQVVLSRAERDSPGRTRAFARELAESVQPVGMTARHARAAAERGVSVRDLADGMAELSVILPATVAYGIRDRLQRQAAAIRAAGIGRNDSAGADAPEPIARARRSPQPGNGRALRAHADPETNARTPPPPHADPETNAPHRIAPKASAPHPITPKSGAPRPTAPETSPPGPAASSPFPDEAESLRDDRTLAQIGADVCADLLLTAAPAVDPTDDVTCPGGLGAIRAQVQITVPVLTLLGRTDAGAAVAGRSPIDPATARLLAARAPGWDRVLCDPVVGTVLEVDRYSPTAAQRRYLAARDQHCRAPGCRAPLMRCQIDHNQEAQHGGATTLSNLAHLCVRHHTLKTETAWSVSQDPDGTLRFRSPLGRDHVEAPPPRVQFVPDVDEGGGSPSPDPPPF